MQATTPGQQVPVKLRRGNKEFEVQVRVISFRQWLDLKSRETPGATP
jgi:hypothetical protein